MAFIELCFGIGHNLSLICQMTSEDIKHQLIIIIISGSFNSDIPHCSLKRKHSNYALWWRLHTNYLFSCILIPFVDSSFLLSTFSIPCFIKLEFMCSLKGSFVVILVVIFLITTQILHMLVCFSVSVWFSMPNQW